MGSGPFPSARHGGMLARAFGRHTDIAAQPRTWGTVIVHLQRLRPRGTRGGSRQRSSPCKGSPTTDGMEVG